ncbi:apical junction molecule-like [Strongylocentrotus purpuratus]|uniref:CCHC-type domain-containing protein n=1 Tax=Strongylocentrotus purpuratus TaxID=7668 RepID=A0A7M7SVM2_STRPU|nr:apical junction molecule-like [Strongylocentrotus purpuratus]
MDGNTTPKSPGGKDKELSNANGNDIDHVVKDKKSGATRSFTRERDLENGKDDRDDSESTLSLCGSSASSASTAKKRERERKKERQLKAKLIALHQTSELEKKLRTLQKQHEMERAEQEIRIAKEKAENLRKSQLLKDEEAEIERQKTAILLQAELKLLQQDSEEELQKWKVEGDSFRDRGQERDQVRGDSFRDRGQERERVRGDFVGDHGQERDQVRGNSFRDRGQERERVRDDFVGDHGQERDQVRGNSFRNRGQERERVRDDFVGDHGQERERVRYDFVGDHGQERDQVRGDSFRDRGQEREQVIGDSFRDRGQERERVRDDVVGDRGQERDQVRGDSFRDRGQERERVRGDFVGGRGQEQAFRKEPVSNEEGATKQMLREMIRFTAENSLPSPDLEPFNGDPLDYLTFIRNFEYVVEKRTDEPFRRLELLLKYTRGEAHELIRECPHIQPSKRAYETAKSMLHRDYGKQSNIINAYKERAIAWEQIRSGDRQGLRKFAIYLNNCSHVRAAGDLGGMDSESFLRVLASKLPLYLQQKWISRVGLTRDIANRNPTLEDLAQFVIQTERNINDPMVQGLGYQRTEKNASYNKDEKEKLQKSRSTKAFGTATQQDKEQKDKREPSCTFCGANSRHVIDECRKFEALSVEERSEQCKRKGLCFRCLKPKHLNKECKSQIKCDVYDRMHNTLMHDPRWMKDGEGNTRKTTNDASTSTDVQSEAGRISSGSTNVKKSVGGKPQTSTCMTIVPVIVKHKGNDRCISTYAFIDNGCGTVFCDTELTQRLHARTRKTKLIVKTLNLEEVIDTEVTVDELQIAGVKEKEFINLPPIYVKDGIPVTVSDAPTQKDLKRWKHLKDIELPEIK